MQDGYAVYDSALLTLNKLNNLVHKIKTET